MNESHILGKTNMQGLIHRKHSVALLYLRYLVEWISRNKCFKIRLHSAGSPRIFKPQTSTNHKTPTTRICLKTGSI